MTCSRGWSHLHQEERSAGDPVRADPFIAGALAGTANKMMMAKAIATDIPAVGLCLADGGLCQVTQLDPALGAVGDCQPGNPALVAGSSLRASCRW